MDRTAMKAMLTPLLLNAESVMVDQEEVTRQFNAGPKSPHYITPKGDLIQMSDTAAQERVVAGSIGVVPINGLMVKDCPAWMEAYWGLCSMDRVAADILRMGADSRVKSVLCVATSPGGQTVGIEKINSAIKDVRATKAVDASVDGYAASACLFAISACGLIHLNGKTTDVGSLGVMACIWDDTQAMAAYGIAELEIYADQSTRKNEEVRALLNDKDASKMKASLTEINTVLLSMAKAGRPKMSAEAATGAMFLSEQAISNGLADDILPLDAVIQQALEAADTTPTDVVIQVDPLAPTNDDSSKNATAVIPTPPQPATPAATTAPTMSKFATLLASLATFGKELVGLEGPISAEQLTEANAALAKEGVKGVELVSTETLAALRGKETSLADLEAANKVAAKASRDTMAAVLKEHAQTVPEAATAEEVQNQFMAHVKTLGSTMPLEAHTGAPKKDDTPPMEYVGHAQMVDNIPSIVPKTVGAN